MKLLLLKMPFQTEWMIKTNCERFFLNLEKKYGGYLVKIDEHIGTPNITVLRCDNNEYLVEINKGKGSNIISSYTECPVSYVNRFLFDNPTYDDNILAWHGAAVEYKGKSYVFLASTTTGKTTLTAFLTSHNCRYITDDCVLLDKRTKEIYRFSTPLHLREGGVEVLKKTGGLSNALTLVTEKDGFCRYVYTPDKMSNDAVPLGEVFFLERTDDENELDALIATEKIAMFLKAPITVYPLTSDYLRLLADIGRSFGKRLRYCDMDYVLEVIEHYADRSSE